VFCGAQGCGAWGTANIVDVKNKQASRANNRNMKFSLKRVLKLYGIEAVFGFCFWYVLVG
jgi:hypothetical protein